MAAFIVQEIEKEYGSDVLKAIRYYSILFSLNDIFLSSKQIELIAFTAVRGTISSSTARKEFIDSFDSSSQSLENIKCKLVKMGWLVKVDRKIRVNEILNLDFTKDLKLEIKLIKNDRVVGQPANTVRQVEVGIDEESE